VGDLGDAVDGGDPIVVGDRQRLGLVDLVEDDQAVGRGTVLAGVEGALEAR